MKGLKQYSSERRVKQSVTHTLKSEITDRELQWRKWVNRSFPYVYRRPAVHDNLPDNPDPPLLQLNTPCTCIWPPHFNHTLSWKNS